MIFLSWLQWWYKDNCNVDQPGKRFLLESKYVICVSFKHREQFADSMAFRLLCEMLCFYVKNLHRILEVYIMEFYK